jgi:hypothetical protein
MEVNCCTNVRQVGKHLVPRAADCLPAEPGGLS